jgi:hypothetical protein
MSGWPLKILTAEAHRLIALAAEDADLRADLRAPAQEILAATEAPPPEAEAAPKPPSSGAESAPPAGGGAPNGPITHGVAQADRVPEPEPLRELTLGWRAPAPIRMAPAPGSPTRPEIIPEPTAEVRENDRPVQRALAEAKAETGWPMKAFPVFPTSLVALSLLALADDRDAPERQPTEIKITTRRADDAVAVRANKDRMVVAVRCPFGISQAVMEWLGDTWPEAVVLRLHLKGLESFRASNGQVRLDAAVSIQEGKMRVRQWKDGNEDALLDETSPFWMDIRIVSGDGRPAQELPLKDGYFEMTLPKVFFEGSPKSITLNWIDFYRQ